MDEWGDNVEVFCVCVLLSSRKKELEDQAGQVILPEEGTHHWQGGGPSKGGDKGSAEESPSSLS